jgi:hypothetical protein
VARRVRNHRAVSAQPATNRLESEPAQVRAAGDRQCLERERPLTRDHRDADAGEYCVRAITGRRA